MQKFHYRNPRYQVDLPVLLILKDESVSGRCKEISREGMTVEFCQPVAHNRCGTLRIGHGDSCLEVRACIARSGSASDGVKFLFDSEREQKALERLVALTANIIGRAGPVLVP